MGYLIILACIFREIGKYLDWYSQVILWLCLARFYM